jgi:tetratricopeptide (TPR) repeat protein
MQKTGEIMITYRNKIWNTLLKFLKVLQEYEPFKTMFNGKYNKRFKTAYEQAVNAMHISSTNWRLMCEAIGLICEKDITDTMIEVFEEVEMLGLKTNRSSDGEKNYEVGYTSLMEKKEKKESEETLEKARVLFKEKELEHEQYMASQEKTLKEYEEAKKAYEEAKVICNSTQ